jgi:hypothetical protein
MIRRTWVFVVDWSICLESWPAESAAMLEETLSCRECNAWIASWLTAFGLVVTSVNEADSAIGGGTELSSTAVIWKRLFY